MHFVASKAIDPYVYTPHPLRPPPPRPFVPNCRAPSFPSFTSKPSIEIPEVQAFEQMAWDFPPLKTMQGPTSFQILLSDLPFRFSSQIHLSDPLLRPEPPASSGIPLKTIQGLFFSAQNHARSFLLLFFFLTLKLRAE